MTSKVSKLWYKLAKNITKKFANIGNILITLFSKFVPSFIMPSQRHVVGRSKQSCRKKNSPIFPIRSKRKRSNHF